MGDNAEAGIAHTQVKSAQTQGAAGLEKIHHKSIAYIDDRILVAIMAIAVLSLMVLWATTTSTLVLYGSLAGIILLVVLWGIERINRLQALQRVRANQAESLQSEN